MTLWQHFWLLLFPFISGISSSVILQPIFGCVWSIGGLKNKELKLVARKNLHYTKPRLCLSEILKSLIVKDPTKLSSLFPWSNGLWTSINLKVEKTYMRNKPVHTIKYYLQKLQSNGCLPKWESKSFLGICRNHRYNTCGRNLRGGLNSFLHFVTNGSGSL